jgi:hypothetical protein
MVGLNLSHIGYEITSPNRSVGRLQDASFLGRARRRIRLGRRGPIQLLPPTPLDRPGSAGLLWVINGDRAD